MAFGETPRYNRLLESGARRYLIRLDLKPAQTLALSFATAILLGAVLLYLPAATTPGHRITFMDALFTATSAVCVTGLTVVDTGASFTPWGQWVILFLIQIGAIGIMTFAAVFAALFGGGMGIRDRLVMQDVLDLESMGGVARLIKAVFKATLAIEAIGALLLYLLFLPYASTQGQAGYLAVFHAISAFANAGFSVFPNSLMDFRGNIGINLVIIALVFAGGLGFSVIVNLRDYLFPGEKPHPLTLHSKVILTTTLLLVFLGGILLLLTEWRGLYRGMPAGEAVLASTFQSVVSRTAGFNTIDVSLIGSGTILVLIFLMAIGGGPGSTAGGVKITTLAVLFATARALYRGRETPELFHRSLPRDIILKAVTLSTLAVIGLLLATLILSFTEQAPLQQILFEAASALGTVGLSMGLTPHLSPLGKIVVIFLMFIGRIGPLGLILAIGQRRKKGLYYYPEERVIMG